MNYYVITDVYSGKALCVLKNTKAPTNKQILFHLQHTLNLEQYESVKDIKDGICVERVEIYEI